MNFALIFCLCTAPAVELYEAPDATCAVAWGNGTDAELATYEPLFAYLNDNGITVAAAVTGRAGDGEAIIQAGQLLRDRGYEHIVAAGHSLGANGALFAAEKRPDLFEAVVPISPGQMSRWVLPHQPCFAVSADRDRLAPPRAVQAGVVQNYPGPIIHAAVSGVGHYAVIWDRRIWEYFAEFVLDDPRFEEITVDANWNVIEDAR
jgi:pimeloyl-ACP methyl ester carboxylesterase